ncbi:two component regulator with propeller domain [Leeuwenhoekiella aestuarii]|uniref:histidine kinase n=1 Tax=Leeuwenhoekiella aestuarii TaxID=2249426 RepID=A0A4V1KPH6_9FLAO|nr:two-component regulator propeller domain-containing protein [Leeuwenhoekiella aestuarii]RXG15583.1 two component regulator with propeller domain [Leeuwenhoekiella aestuarii]RXG17308.1 two component regulator with propeller domain [Leeuwenhoekiella aestuarii]
MRQIQIKPFVYFLKFISQIFRFKGFIPLSLISIFFVLEVSAQKNSDKILKPKKLNFYKLDTEDGLSNNMVRVIEQDELGFIWIGTADGINRYDGNEFTVYRKENSAISDNYLQNILLDTITGNLLIGNDGGLHAYNPYLNTFERYKPQDIVLSNSVNTITYRKSGEFYMGDYSVGLRVLKNKKQIDLYEHDPLNGHSLSSNKISAITIQKDSIVWIGTQDAGLNKLDIQKKQVTRIPLNNKSDFRVNSLLVDSDQNLWVGTNEGVKIITKVNKVLTITRQNSDAGLSGNDVTCFEEDEFGRIWVGTYDGGLNIIEKSNFQADARFKIEKYLPKEDGTSVYNATIFSIKKDRSGNMWLGTYGGINYVNPRGEPVQIITNSLTGSEHIIHNRINALAEDTDSRIWLGTDGGGVDCYDPKTNKFDYDVLTEANGLKTDHVFSIIIDNEKLWVGTYLGGVNVYDKKTKKWKYYLQGTQKDGNDVRVLYKTKKGEIWAGTNRGGLFRYSETKDQFEYIESLNKIDVRAIAEDASGNLWLGTYGDGIINYNIPNDNSTYYQALNLNGLKSNVIFSVLVLPDGNILAGTKHVGLVLFKPGATEALNLDEQDGLSNNTINSLVAFDANTVCLGTFKGVSKYNIKSQEVTSLNNLNNIQKSEYNPGAVLKSRSGLLYFGSNKGLNAFNPNDLSSQTQERAIIIKDLLVFNESVTINPEDKDAVLQKSMLYEDSISLDSDKTVFSIEFTSLNFPFADNTSYSYILEGFNEHWIDLKNSNRINFSNIPPGDYTLKIKAQSLADLPLYKELQIAVLPPIWKTLPAYFVYFGIFFVLIISGLKYYSERIYLKNSLLFEKKQRRLEHELNEERIRFYTGFSHELKTPLTLILAPLETLLQETVHKQHLKNLKLIKRNADNLLQFINKLLEFRKSEEGLSKLQINKYNFSKNLTNWLAGYDPLLKKKELELMITMPQTPLRVYCDLEKVQVIVNNLISNAIKYSPKGEKIHVELGQDEDYLIFKVSDNGSGIKTQDLDHIFEWYYQSNTSVKKDGSGIGLALSKRFAELHKGVLKVTSKEGKGSVFILQISKDERLLDEYLTDNNYPLDNKRLIEQQINANTLTPEKDEVQNILASPENKRKLILLIDDNPDILEFLDSALAQEYDLIHAEDGEEGIDKATSYIPDLIISDIMMPVKNGIDLCNFIKNKKETSHIPIILLSAKSNFEMIETGYSEGADDYMLKPFNVQVLKARVANLIESRAKLLSRFANADLSDTDSEQKKLLDIEKQFLTEFHEIVHQNMQQGIKTVEVVSEKIGMSRSSLYRKIKAITGQNINEYIRNIKIEHAAYLIEKEKFTISQAAYEVGFGDAKYFRKIFKEKYGKPPSAFKPS